MSLHGSRRFDGHDKPIGSSGAVWFLESGYVKRPGLWHEAAVPICESQVRF